MNPIILHNLVIKMTNKWLLENFPNVRIVDCKWTFEKYNYPEETRKYIKENWIKLNDDNGGTYVEPNYHKDEKIKNMAKEYQKTTCYQRMDDNNKNALQIMAEEGQEKAVEFMFTHPITKKRMSYAEMRSFYG